MVKAEQINKFRHGNSTVYEFHILVNGVKVVHQPNPDEPLEFKIFSIQVSDGIDAGKALLSFLTDYKSEISNPPADDLPIDVEV